MPPEQIAAHAAECGGCSTCHGEPPTAPALRRRITAAWLGEVFKPGYDPQQPTELLQLLHTIDAEQRAEQRAEFIAAQRQRAAVPRKVTPELVAQLVASRDEYLAKYKMSRGWLQHAARHFEIDAKTIKRVLKEAETD